MNNITVDSLLLLLFQSNNPLPSGTHQHIMSGGAVFKNASSQLFLRLDDDLGVAKLLV